MPPAAVARPALRDSLRLAWRLAVEGGITVVTPAEAPAIATLLQADGDMVVTVSRSLLAASPDARSGLLAAHVAGVRAVLDGSARLVRILGRLGTLLAALRLWGTLAGLGLSALPAASALRGNAPALIATWSLPSLLLPALAWLLRPALRFALIRAARGWT
ncbi:MAG: hypothetical protein RQ966_04555 [Acetobacteraceae bacterium]|nr:hypothetical protein [Acetobacteraceae bacterium]